MRLLVRAPLRIDFAGGWTDVPVYASREGGAVVNAAITRYVRGSLSRPPDGGPLRRFRSGRSYLSYSLDLPSGAGLGASAAQTVAWAALVRAATGNTADRRAVAEAAVNIAGALGLTGGKQDEYAASFGGIHLLVFGEDVQLQPIQLDAVRRAALVERLVLVYSGERRLSGAIHDHVWSAYRRGETATLQSLSRLKQIAHAMPGALLSGDFVTFAQLINDNWEQQKQLHPTVTNASLEALIHHGRAHGAAAAKACGAGGGGCVVFVADEGRSEELRTALRSSRAAIIDFAFDDYGVRVTRG